MLQFVLVLRRGHDHVRHMPQEREIEGTVVRRPVLSDESAPIDTEGHRQVLRRHIMHDLVIRPLQKKVEYRATTGFMPCAAIPAAKVTACCSAMPTS